MDRGVKIPEVGGSKYHGYGVTMPYVGGRNTMCRVFDIPWVESKYHGYGVKIYKVY